MKKGKALVKIFSIILAVFIMLCINVVSFFAADDFKSGDTVTYYVTMQSKENVGNIRFTISYNTDTLEMDKSLINFPYVETNTCNAETPGKIVVMVMEQDGYDFTKEQQLITVTFKIKNGYKNGDVKFEMNDLYNTNLEVIANSDYSIKEEFKSGSIPKDEVKNPGDLIVKNEGGADNAFVNNSEQPKAEMHETDPIMFVLIGVGAVALLVIVAVIIVNIRKNKQFKLQENTTESNN